MEYQDIDWNQLWQESRRKKSWAKKKESDWDQRAASFAKRNLGSSYVLEFLGQLSPRPEWTVLDVGCGPGTLSLPLALKVKQVTAVDFSPLMLEVLTKKACEEGSENIQCIRAAWEDDWDAAGIRVHDVAIASRSLAVQDLRSALAKLDAHASRAVFITDRVGAGPFFPDLFEAVGRPFRSGPDYILTVNLLYQMGIRANVNFISADSKRPFASREEAWDSVAWMLDDPTPDEKEKLRCFMEERLQELPGGHWVLRGRSAVLWALIWWYKEPLQYQPAPTKRRCGSAEPLEKE